MLRNRPDDPVSRFVPGTVLVVLGVLALVEALRLKDDWQGAKLMPAVVGAILVILGAAHATLAPDAGPWPDRAGLRRVLMMLGILVLYVGILPEIGFLPATVILTLAIVRALGAYSWTMTAVWTVLIAVASHVVFKHWLGMPLPEGPLGF